MKQFLLSTMLILLLALAGLAGAQTLVQEVGANGVPGEDGESATASGVEVKPGADPVALTVWVLGSRS